MLRNPDDRYSNYCNVLLHVEVFWLGFFHLVGAKF